VFNTSLFRDKAHAAATEGADGKAAAALPAIATPSPGDLWPIEPVAYEILSDTPIQK
jgi:hypothetical protein